MTDDTKNLIAFVSTLLAIVALSKIGGTGSDLAIMTGLVGILGMLARPPRSEPKSDNPSGTKEDPLITETKEPQEVDVISSEENPVHTKSKGKVT